MIISSSLARVATSPGHHCASRRQPPPLLLNPLVWMALQLLDLNKVGVKGCSARHPVFEVKCRGLLFNATPNMVSRECLIETIMRKARSGIEPRQLAGNQSCLSNKKVKDY